MTDPKQVVGVQKLGCTCLVATAPKNVNLGKFFVNLCVQALVYPQFFSILIPLLESKLNWTMEVKEFIEFYFTIRYLADSKYRFSA